MISFFIFLCLVLVNIVRSEVIKCASKLKKDTCGLYGYEYLGETRQAVTYVKACGSGEECKFVVGVGVCLPIQKKQKEGEDCEQDFECEIGKCESNECKSYSAGQTCKDNSNICDSKTFCNKTSGLCEAIIPEGGNCTLDEMGESLTSVCELGSLCGMIDETVPKCVKAFSLKTGTKVLLLQVDIYVKVDMHTKENV